MNCTLTWEHLQQHCLSLFGQSRRSICQRRFRLVHGIGLLHPFLIGSIRFGVIVVFDSLHVRFTCPTVWSSNTLYRPSGTWPFPSAAQDQLLLIDDNVVVPSSTWAPIGNGAEPRSFPYGSRISNDACSERMADRPEISGTGPNCTINIMLHPILPTTDSAGNC